MVSAMQKCVLPDDSQQSRGQMSQLMRSRAKPIHTLVLALLVSVMRWRLRRSPLIQIHLKTYIFSLLWASIHTKLIVFTPEKQITIKCLYSHKIVCQTPILCDQILWKAEKEPRPAGSEQNPNICVKMMSTFSHSPHQMFMVRTVAVCYSFVNLWEKYGGQESSTQCNIRKHIQIDKRRC